MRLFGSERIINMMESLGVDEDTPIEHKMLSNAIEQAQKTVESKTSRSARIRLNTTT
jgi:preprotein translocase subunit SecA